MSYLSVLSLNTEVKGIICMVKILCAYVKMLSTQIGKVPVSVGNGSDRIETSTMSAIFWFIFCLAELYLIACNYPSNLWALACNILQPDLPLLMSHFIHFQLQLNNADPNIAPPYPDISESPVSVFHSVMSSVLKSSLVWSFAPFGRQLDRDQLQKFEILGGLQLN